MLTKYGGVSAQWNDIDSGRNKADHAAGASFQGPLGVVP